MAKVSDSELVVLVEQTLGDYLSSHSSSSENVCRGAAESIVRAINDAGITAIREERNRTRGANAAVLDPLRHTVAATT